MRFRPWAAAAVLGMAAFILPAGAGRAAAPAGQAEDGAVQQQIKRLGDADAIARIRAARALGEMGAAAHAALPPLDAMNADADADVRAIAARTAKKIREAVKGRVAEQVAQLAGKDAKDRRKAVDELAGLGALSKPAVPVLKKMLKDPDAGVRAAARGALDRIGEALLPDAVKSLLKEMESPDKTARRAAIDAVASLGADAAGALPALRKASQDTDATIRIAALQAVARIEAEQARAGASEPLASDQIAGEYVGADLEDDQILDATWKKRSANAMGVATFTEQSAAAARGRVRQLLKRARYKFSDVGDMELRLTLPQGWEDDFGGMPEVTLRGATRDDPGARVFSVSKQGSRIASQIWLDGKLRLEDGELKVYLRVSMIGSNAVGASIVQRLSAGQP